MLRSLLLLIAPLYLAACGGNVVFVEEGPQQEEETQEDPVVPVEVPTPERVFYADGACVAEVATSGTQPLFEDLQSGERRLVVETFLVRECSGAGGDYVLARELTGSRSYWLGDHTCYFLGNGELPTTTSYGVIRVTQTAALSSVPTGWCIGFPGEDGLSSDSNVTAVALFASLEEAQAYLDSLEP
jgi:hypothetical protein